MLQKQFLNKQYKKEIKLIQINMGTRCNQRCIHCHVGGGPGGVMMDFRTAENIIAGLNALSVKKVELTGGAPELNPSLRIFIKNLSSQGKQLTVRTNLTALALSECSFYPDLYKKHKVKLIASLPCYMPENVDQQRGQGVFQTSIAVLKKLNSIGYGTNGLQLDLVYNPLGGFLPPEQSLLEHEYKHRLHAQYGITFNSLIPITNVPVGRFREFLDNHNKYEAYLLYLDQTFNPATLSRLMCRSLLSVNYQGYVYDCDFNLALGIKIKGYEQTRFWEIDFARFAPEILFDEHCCACTAGNGSSCHGTLVQNKPVQAVSNDYEHSFSHL